jgi:hypothetical protein
VGGNLGQRWQGRNDGGSKKETQPGRSFLHAGFNEAHYLTRNTEIYQPKKHIFFKMPRELHSHIH